MHPSSCSYCPAPHGIGRISSSLKQQSWQAALTLRNARVATESQVPRDARQAPGSSASPELQEVSPSSCSQPCTPLLTLSCKWGLQQLPRASPSSSQSSSLVLSLPILPGGSGILGLGWALLVLLLPQGGAIAQHRGCFLCTVLRRRWGFGSSSSCLG